MLKNFNTTLKNLDGSDAIDDKTGNVITVKVIIANALLNADEESSGDDKAMRYSLAMKIYNVGEIDVKPEEIVLIKKVVGKHPMPIVVGQVFEFLND